MSWRNQRPRNPAQARMKRLKAKRTEAHDLMFRARDFRAAFNAALRAVQAEAAATSRRSPGAGERIYAVLTQQMLDYAEAIADGWIPRDGEIERAGFRIRNFADDDRHAVSVH